MMPPLIYFLAAAEPTLLFACRRRHAAPYRYADYVADFPPRRHEPPLLLIQRI
jgi:hypothetical protein